MSITGKVMHQGDEKSVQRSHWCEAWLVTDCGGRVPFTFTSDNPAEVGASRNCLNCFGPAGMNSRARKSAQRGAGIDKVVQFRKHRDNTSAASAAG